MKRVVAGAGMALLIAGAAAAQPGDRAQIERGEYLVNGVAGCNDCHTPHDAQGQIVPGQTLLGAPLGFAPTPPNPLWADRAPRIAGLPPGYTQTSLARLLETGRKPTGVQPRPPMPQYRMKPEDAEAVAAYIASLQP